MDGDRRLVGILPFKSLVVSRPERQIRQFMEPADISVKPDLDPLVYVEGDYGLIASLLDTAEG